MKRAWALLLLSGCGGLSQADRALLDGPLPADVPGAWVVWSLRHPEIGCGSVLVVERDGRAWSVSREQDFHDQLLQLMSPPPNRNPRTVERRDEGTATPAQVAELQAALKAPPPPARDPSHCVHLVVRDDPGEAPRRLTFDIPPSSEEGFRNWHPLQIVLVQIYVGLSR